MNSPLFDTQRKQRQCKIKRNVSLTILQNHPWYLLQRNIVLHSVTQFSFNVDRQKCHVHIQIPMLLFYVYITVFQTTSNLHSTSLSPLPSFRNESNFLQSRGSIPKVLVHLRSLWLHNKQEKMITGIFSPWYSLTDSTFHSS